LKIGELAKLTGCSVQTIRFYEKEQLLSVASRSEGNYRLYNQANLEQLTFIKHCRNLDITLVEIKRLLKLKQSPEIQCKEVNNLIDEHISQINSRLFELNKLKDSLSNLREKCNVPRSIKDCGILNNLVNHSTTLN